MGGGGFGNPSGGYGGGYTNWMQPGGGATNYLGQGGPAQLKGGVGSADWISTHPNFQAPSQGVGSMDWLKTHPNFGNPQQGQPQQYGGLGGPAPLQQGQPDMMTALMRMFGGGGGYGNQMMF